MATNPIEIVQDSARSTGANKALLALYAQMVLIRTVEQALLDLFSKGLLRGTVHTCLGQEAIPVGLIGAIDRDRDIVCSNHRGHGHYLAYCGDITGLIAEVMGRPDGVCGGAGGSQHLHRDNFYSNGILGGMSPVTTGMALAEKLKNSGAVSLVFHGDGAMAEGAIYEAMNIASLWQLPILFAIEKNNFAQSTPISREIAGSFCARAEAFGIQTVDVDGNDVESVRGASDRVLAAMRQDGQPRLMLFETWRLGPHSKGDDDRDPEEIERRMRDCPIARAAARLDPTDCAHLRAEMENRVAGIVETLTENGAPSA